MTSAESADCAQQTLSTKTTDDVFTQLFRHDREVNLVCAQLANQRRILATNELKYQQLLANLAELRKSNDDWKSDIHLYEIRKAELVAGMSTLRSWGSAVNFPDLPPELLAEVLKYLGWVHQQKFVRVCKLWMHIIVTALDHIYLDAESIFTSHVTADGLLILSQSGISPITVLRGQKRDPIPKQLASSVHRVSRVPDLRTTCAWKFGRRSVRQLTFNGQYTAHFLTVSECMANLATSHFPDLLQINLLHVVMNLGSAEDHLALEGVSRCIKVMRTCLTQKPSQLQLTMKNSVIPAFSFLRYKHDHMGILSGRESSEWLKIRYVRIPDMTWFSAAEFGTYFANFRSVSNMAWSHPDSQLEWLARWAPRLKGHEEWCCLLELPAEARVSSLRSVLRGIHGRAGSPSEMLSFCMGLDGQARNLVAFCLMRLEMPGVDAPPVPWQFEKFHLQGGKRAQFGPEMSAV